MTRLAKETCQNDRIILAYRYNTARGKSMEVYTLGPPDFVEAIPFDSEASHSK